MRSGELMRCIRQRSTSTETMCRRQYAASLGMSSLAVLAQHPHLGEVDHVDRTAKAAQGEVCKMQERSKSWTLEENTLSDADTESSNYKEPFQK